MQLQRPLYAASAIALASILTFAACADEGRTTPTVARDLRGPSTQAAPTIPLAPRILTTQDEFDDFEDELRGRMSLRRIAELYESLARDARPEARDSDALLLQRLALIQLGDAQGREGLMRAFEVVERLKEKAPEHPHTLYILARLKALLLESGAPINALNAGGATRDVAVQLRDDWQRLLKAAPDYDGPGTDDAAALTRAMDALTANLGGDAPVAPVAALAPAVTPVEDAVITARRSLIAFELGTDIERLTLCRDRRTAKVPGGRSEMERWMDLQCHEVLSEAAPGLRLIASLITGDEGASACSWADRMKRADGPGFDAATSERAALVAALQKAGAGPCAELAP